MQVGARGQEVTGGHARLPVGAGVSGGHWRALVGTVENCWACSGRCRRGPLGADDERWGMAATVIAKKNL